jgi:hypothetical protein
MIKKILLTALVAVSSIAYSAETVLVAWPFGIGDSTAGYSRMATKQIYLCI